MNALTRLRLELAQVKRCFEPQVYNNYRAAVALNALQIVRQRTLVPADHTIKGDVNVNVANTKIVVPLDKIRAIVQEHDHTPTFGGLREMYASNVYLRGFRDGLKATNVLDLGSNRGLFLMLAAKVLGANKAIGVEPNTYYEGAFEALRDANPDVTCTFHRMNRLAGSVPNENQITISELMQRFDVPHFEFCKCDIEGGEFDIFISTPEVAQHFDNIAFEVHPKSGNVEDLMNVLQQQGFSVRVTDQFNNDIAPTHGDYLYASRSGDLKPGR